MIAGIVAMLVFAALAIYYLTAATGHPRWKHTLLFTGLAVLSLIVSWFMLPPRRKSSES
jgi:hypothetical protein